MKKDIEWLKETLEERIDTMAKYGDVSYSIGLKEAYQHTLLLINQLDEPKVLSPDWIDSNSVYASADGVTEEYVHVDDLQNLLVPKQEEVDLAYRKGFKEGERQTAEYFESITEEPSKEQVWKYLSEHGIEVVDKEPETVADVVSTFWKSYERLKEVMSREVEELEE